jgi:hypothetical protein
MAAITAQALLEPWQDEEGSSLAGESVVENEAQAFNLSAEIGNERAFLRIAGFSIQKEKS